MQTYALKEASKLLDGLRRTKIQDNALWQPMYMIITLARKGRRFQNGRCPQHWTESFRLGLVRIRNRVGRARARTWWRWVRTTYTIKLTGPNFGANPFL